MSPCALVSILEFDRIRHASTPECTGFAHAEYTQIATFTRFSSGSWRVQIRRKGRYVAETFLRHDHAREWATETENQIDRGRSPVGKRARATKTFGNLIDLHIDDMKDVGKPPGRSKSAILEMLHRKLGTFKASELDREKIIKFGRDRSKQGAGPVTLSMDIGAIRLVILHAIAVHGLELSVEPVDMARIALKRLGSSAKATSETGARLRTRSSAC